LPALTRRERRLRYGAHTSCGGEPRRKNVRSPCEKPSNPVDLLVPAAPVLSATHPAISMPTAIPRLTDVLVTITEGRVRTETKARQAHRRRTSQPESLPPVDPKELGIKLKNLFSRYKTNFDKEEKDSAKLTGEGTANESRGTQRDGRRFREMEPLHGHKNAKVGS
ncbi:unnamed protein product, partial [Pylaiella littoralis]